MRNRCNNKNNKRWEYYGGRGIKVCERWTAFDKFLSDMGRKPSPLHSIDRINNNGDYEPDNCHWATPHEQAKNKRVKTHCANGHEYAGDNMSIRRDGRRRCKICIQDRIAQ